MDLITHATPDDPVLDIALSHALLREVAAGRRSPALRLFRPGPTVALGRLDALRPGFDRACAIAVEHGHVPAVRPAGGHAAVYGPACLIVERLTAEDDVTAGLEERFAAQAALLRDALAGARGRRADRRAAGRVLPRRAQHQRRRPHQGRRDRAARDPPRRADHRGRRRAAAVPGCAR